MYMCVCVCKNEHNELSVLCLSPIGLNILLIKYLLQTFYIQLLTEVQQKMHVAHCKVDVLSKSQLH